MGRLKFIAALALTAPASITTTVLADTPEIREAWLRARTAIRNGQHDLSVGRALRRYALYPYLEGESILAALHSPELSGDATDRAREFLRTHADTAIEDAFRRDLLYNLAELGQWEPFVELYSPTVANEARECEYLSARVRLERTEGLSELIERRWLTPRRLNSACEPAFEWLRRVGALDADLTARRVELLLENGHTDFARIVARRLPQERAEGYLQWAQMLDEPLESLAVLSGSPATARHPNALPTTWTRASTRTPAQALELLPALLRTTDGDAEATQFLLRTLALGLAWDRRAEAIDVFEQMSWSAHDDYSLSWLTRAALWNLQWPLAARALDALSDSAAEESGWTYWRARTHEQLGDSVAANAAYAALRGRDNFYSAMTAARSGTAIVPGDRPMSRADSLIGELAERSGFVRANELHVLGEVVMATREWRYATADLDQERLVAAMQLAGEWQWHAMAVATATRAGVFFDYRRLYPQPFGAAITAAAATHSLEPSLFTGLIRQESMFRPDAVSSADALGLAQLGVGTAVDTARAIGIAPPSRNELFEPATNAHLGAATLALRLQRFDRQLPVALAAYNAGAAAAARWLPSTPIAADIWVENIPYNETRDYVQRVLWNSIVYAWLDGNGQPVDASYLLGPIGPIGPPGAASAAGLR